MDVVGEAGSEQVHSDRGNEASQDLQNRIIKEAFFHIIHPHQKGSSFRLTNQFSEDGEVL